MPYRHAALSQFDRGKKMRSFEGVFLIYTSVYYVRKKCLSSFKKGETNAGQFLWVNLEYDIIDITKFLTAEKTA